MRLVPWAAVASIIFSACFPRMRLAPELTAPQGAASIERGRYLAVNVLGCADCHSPRAWDQIGAPAVEGREYTGGFLYDARVKIDGDAFPGVVQAPNITQHLEDGIGAWNDGEIARAIREGVNRRGEAMLPMMPYPNYRVLSDEELLDVIAYLRTIPPRAGKTARRELDFPYGFLIDFLPAPVEGPVSAPDAADAVKHGERLVTLAGCHDCHSPMRMGLRIEGEELSGGTIFSFPVMGTLVMTNVTPDDATGIGQASEAEFIAMMREGFGKYGQGMSGLMPWVFYRGMTDDDLKAIYAYLRSVPAVKKDAYEILAAHSRED